MFIKVIGRQGKRILFCKDSCHQFWVTEWFGVAGLKKMRLREERFSFQLAICLKTKNQNKTTTTKVYNFPSFHRGRQALGVQANNTVEFNE